MRDPKKLLVLRHSRALAVSVYRLTAGFPASERFGLTAQMRRSAVAVGSHISEGCGRQGNREFLHSLYLARGDATELGYQAELSAELGFAEADTTRAVLDAVDHLQRMLNRLTASIRSSKKKRKGTDDGSRAPPE